MGDKNSTQVQIPVKPWPTLIPSVLKATVFTVFLIFNIGLMWKICYSSRVYGCSGITVASRARCRCLCLGSEISIQRRKIWKLVKNGI